MRNMRIAELLFNRPLLISEGKLNTILHALGPRFNLEMSTLPGQQAAVLSNDERFRAGYQVQDGVAIIGIYGALVHRALASDYPSGGPTTYADIRRTFDTALSDDGVKSIIFDIDSPGGEVHGVFDLADHIYEARSIKPSTALVNESAYSAGYLLASAASRIILPRTAGVGSVGVIATHADFSRAEDAEGITVTHVFSGARKADFSPHQPLSNEALTLLQAMVDETYGMFVETVARNRKKSVKSVRETQAGMYEGKKAVEIGFADEVTRVDRALANARTKTRSIISPSGTSAGSNKPSKEITTMDAQTLRQEHPEAVAEIETAAREGMITNQASAESQTLAVTAATTTERSRILGLSAVAAGIEATAKLTALVESGITADQAKALGVTADSGDTSTRAAILEGITAVAASGLKPGQVAQPAAATINTSAIYAARQGQRQ
ncbi:MAG: hypothetical protein A2Y38_24885 [Spirochaetes bacterium GWB1_59_5]|nr:MAG: hypothetical protein A2Y38_24885 [Spirochaetes bacterium GWB1_59_5]